MIKDKNLGIVTMCETRTSCYIDRVVHENCRLKCTLREDGRHSVGVPIKPELAKGIEAVNCVNERTISMAVKL